MKRFLLSLALLPATLFGQSNVSNVQKGGPTVPSTQVSNGNVTIGSGTSLTPTGSGVIIATGGTASTMPWSGLTAIPSPTLSATGDVTGNWTLSATVGASGALTVAKIQGTTVMGTTGTGNVVFSSSPTISGILTVQYVDAPNFDALSLNGGSSGPNISLGSGISGSISMTPGSSGLVVTTFSSNGALATSGGGGLVGVITGTTGQVLTATTGAAPAFSNQVSDASLTNSSGTSTITPTSQVDTENVTLSGSAGTRNVVLSTAAAVSGARCDVVFAIPATASIVVNVYSGSTAGTLIQSFTTTGSSAITSAVLTCEFSGGNWQSIFYQGPIP